jgi:hypothetical protein
MIRKNAVFAAMAMALLLLASCGSTSDIFGGGNNDTYNRTLHGTVDTVDLNSNSIVLTNTSGYTTNLSSGGGNSVRVYFDNNTTVAYNGQTFRPENLDRGDQVDINVRQSGNQLYADTMTVTYNANPNGTNSGVYASGNYSGTVRYVDTTRRTIQIDRGSGSYATVDYDPNTTVIYNGRSYMPADLEVGDQITIYTRDIGGGHMVASNIDVTRSMTSGGTSSSNYATIRGTVRSINTYNRTIDLEQTSYISGFLPGSGSRSSVITVQYDTNARVNASGSMQPISGLERGDTIEIQAQDLGNSNWMASSITLVRDVRR